MKVCFVASCSTLGGAERVLLETIDVLRDIEVECCVLLPNDGEFAQQLRNEGLPHAFVKPGSWIAWEKTSLWRRIRAAIKIGVQTVLIARKVSAWKCDVVYSNTLVSCAASIAARLLGLPHIWHLHEFGREDHGISYQFGEILSSKAIGAMSSVCIVVSKALAYKYSRHIQHSKVRVIYPSMHRAERTHFHDGFAVDGLVKRDKRFRIAIVGGLIEGKGQTDVVRALKVLVSTGIDAELLIVGDGDPDYRRKLEELIYGTGIAERVTFLGRVKDPSHVLRSSDVVVVCSRCEAFGRATVEAMFAGKPVIGARTGATPELIEEGVNGLLYKHQDHIDLAAKLRYVHQNPLLAHRLAMKATEWADMHFTRGRYARELYSVLLPIVEAKGYAGAQRASSFQSNTDLRVP